jgi:hypothetical protein
MSPSWQAALIGILTGILLPGLAPSSRGADKADPKKNIVTVEQVKGWLAVEAARTTDKRKDYSWETFKLKHDLNHPGQPITGDELNKYDPPSRVVDENGNALPSGSPIFQDIEKDGVNGLVKHFKIRSSFDDVVTAEDPTVNNAKPKNKPSDLTGATFSYSRDFLADSTSWVAKGALIMPFSEVFDTRGTSESSMQTKIVGFAPSVSFDREINGSDSKKDKDSLIFRLGAYAKWIGPEPYLTSLTLRLYGSYGTDFEFHSEIPASELELEPVIQGLGPLGIGTRHFITETTDEQAKAFSPTNVAYQLRVILHAQYGQISDAGMTGLPEENFLRLGPKLKFRLDPLFTPNLTCDIGYEYQGDIVGHSKNHGLLSIEPALILNKPPADATRLDQPLIKLSASYQNGGLDLTKQAVHTILVGLGVTY